MTARTVRGYVEYPSGDGMPYVGVRVVAELYSGDQPAIGSANDTFIGSAAAMTDNAGLFVFSLEPNANITPAGTVWKITIPGPARSSTSYYIDVPDSVGPHDVADILSQEPTAILGFAWNEATATESRSSAKLNAARNFWINVRDYGAVGDGTTDDSAAISSAITAHGTDANTEGTTGAVFFPPGRYRVASTIDCANDPALRLVGAGRMLSSILMDTGGVCVDATGTEAFLMEGLGLSAGSNNPSTVGVLLARSTTSTSVDGHHITGCHIRMGSDPTANDGVGRIALYNNAAEVGLVDRCEFTGDLPVVLTGNNVFDIESSIATHYTGSTSMAACSFYACNMSSRSGLPAITLDAAISVRFDGCYLHGTPTTGTTAIDIRGVNWMCSFEGHIEGFNRAVSTKIRARGLKLRATMAMQSGHPSVYLDGTDSASGLLGCDIAVMPTSGTGNVVEVSSSSGQLGVAGCAITLFSGQTVSISGGTNIGNVYRGVSASVPTVSATTFVELAEISDPSAPSSNLARLYAKDNGSGKTQIVARFPTGAVQVIATEP